MSKRDRIGRVASILYRGGAKDEEQLDDHSSGEPLQIVLGENAIPKGIETLLYELEIGEEREIEIAPDMGSGYPSSEGVQWYPRTIVYNGAHLQAGDVIVCPNTYDASDSLPGRIIATTDDLVQIDVNHPYAGKTLAYWVKLVDLT